LIRFSLVHDEKFPEVDGLYIGGGYPEVHAAELSKNKSMREAVRVFAGEGGVVYAECGGLMYLCSGIRTKEGVLHPMTGVFPCEAVMSERLQAIGYVEVETKGSSFLGPVGLRFRGHQYRYSILEPEPDSVVHVYTLSAHGGGPKKPEGYRCGERRRFLRPCPLGVQSGDRGELRFCLRGIARDLTAFLSAYFFRRTVFWFFSEMNTTRIFAGVFPMFFPLCQVFTASMKASPFL
jgi:hypothetical protein